MKKVKKNTVGYCAVGSGDDDYSHVILMRGEYEDLQRQIHVVGEEAESQHKAVQDTYARLRQKSIAAKEETQTIAAEAQDAIAYYRRRSERLEDELSKSQAANANLLRISRERANSARGLTPKKEHDGYVILSTQQWTQSYSAEVPMPGYESRSIEWLRAHDRVVEERRTATVWKTNLQTPYDALIDYEYVREQVLADICEKNILADLGFDMWLWGDADNAYAQLLTPDGLVPGVYKIQFRADYRAGLWTLEFFSSAPPAVSDKRIGGRH